MRNGTLYDLWEHGQSGTVFAVRMNETGRLTGCCGPLLSNQIRVSALEQYPYDENPRDLAWIEADREDWVLSELAAPPHY
jgi:hypothetical protein